jgi:hypothetical protein
MTYCSDIDLLHWEPSLFRDADFASQLLLSGTATLTGVTLGVSGISFNSSHIAPGQVACLAGATTGCFPIVSVEDSAHLTLSVLYDRLIESGQPAPPSPSTGSVSFAIRTFFAQRKLISDMLTRAAGVEPMNDGASAAICNPSALCRAATLGTLQLIYSAMAVVADEPAPFNLRADLYQRLYQRAVRQVCVEIDTNGDGRADTARHLGMLELRRT